MSYTLPISLKRFNSSDWKALSNHVKDQGDDLVEAVKALGLARESLRNSTDRTDSHLSSLYKYYAQITSMDGRVPISEREVRVTFQWYDIYKEKKISQYNLSFERAGVLWNIIATHSHIGSAEKRLTEDSIKIAAKNFQTASGIVSVLRKHLETHPSAAENIDMSSDSLTFINNLMLAHAQECYYDLAVKKGAMAPADISKIAYQVSSFHSTCVSMIEGVLKDLSVPKKILYYCKLKRELFKALSFYHLSLDRLANHAYGEQVSRLASAYKCMELIKTEKWESYISEINDSLKAREAMIGNAYATANKENNKIYMVLVPNESSLPALTGQTMAKTVEPDASRFYLASDPFARIVPIAVQQADSAYCEKRGDMIRQVVKKVEEQDGLVKVVLAEMGLPASLDSMDSSSSINTLQGKINTIQNEGGVTFLKEKTTLLEELAEVDARILRDALAALDTEENEDKTMRAQYGAEWSRTPSHILNASLREEAAKYYSNFEQARKSDDYIKSKFSSHAPQISKLSTLNKQSLMNELPSDSNDSSSASTIVSSLRNSIAQIDQLISTRAALVSSLRTQATNDNIIGTLIAQPTRDGDAALFDKELAKFDLTITDINETYNTQTQLIQSIRNQNAEFLASRRVTPVMAQRETILQSYEVAFQCYVDLKGHLNEGATFYTKFQSVLNKFITRCHDFTFARKTEMEDYVAEINRKQKAQAQASAPVSSPATSVYIAVPQSSFGIQPISHVSQPSPFGPPPSYMTGSFSPSAPVSSNPSPYGTPSYMVQQPKQNLPPGYSFNPPSQY